MVDALGVLEAAGFFGQGRQEVLGVAGLGSRVTSTEGASRVVNRRTALAAGGGAVLASLRGEVGAGRFLCHFDPRLGGWDTPHPRVFWEKSAQSIENKGWEVEKERQESSRVRKRLEG